MEGYEPGRSLTELTVGIPDRSGLREAARSSCLKVVSNMLFIEIVPIPMKSRLL